MVESSYEDLVAMTYEAAQTPDLWTDVLAQLGRAAGLDAWVLFSQHKPSRTIDLALVGGERMNATTFDRYLKQFLPIDPRLAAVRDMPAGRIVVTQHIHDERFVARNPFYQDYLIPSGRRWDIGGRAFLSDEREYILALSRGQERGAFAGAVCDQVQGYFEHVHRAIGLMERLGRLDQQTEMGEASLASNAWAVFSLGRDGHVRDGNGPAHALLRSGRMLQSEAGRLKLVDAQLRARWSDQLQRCTFTRQPVSMLLRDPESGQRCSLTVTRCQRPPKSLLGGVSELAHFMVIVAPLDEKPMVSRQQLMDLFGMTPTEARLACNLAQGMTLDSHAERVGVTLATVRTQMRAVLSKAEVRNQSELQRLLAKLPALPEVC